MIIRMKLLSDCIFGSGQSIPGGEDIGIICDKEGFPYLKGTTFRGVLREEAENACVWDPETYSDGWMAEAFGVPGLSPGIHSRYIAVSDFVLPGEVRRAVRQELESPSSVTDVFTSLRTFTRLTDGIAAEGSLRIARCINKDLCFYGRIDCTREDEERIKELISYIKWMGSMRTRGFGRVEVSVPEAPEGGEQEGRP